MKHFCLSSNTITTVFRTGFLNIPFLSLVSQSVSPALLSGDWSDLLRLTRNKRSKHCFPDVYVFKRPSVFPVSIKPGQHLRICVGSPASLLSPDTLFSSMMNVCWPERSYVQSRWSRIWFGLCSQSVLLL